jgi:phosphatidylglycerol lysyltransferase
MPRNLFHRLAALFGLVLFGIALWVIFHELRAFNYHDVVHHLRALPPRRFGLALLLAMCNYLVLTGYDTLAFRYIHHPLPYRKIALTSFIGYAFSHNIGLTFLTNGSVRYRFYSSWGLSALDITKVIVFCGLTFWLGFFTIGGSAFLFAPFALPAGFPLPAGSVRWLGAGFLAITAGYLALSAGLRQSLKLRQWVFQLPSFPLACSQVALSALDWGLAGSVLYALLPPAPGLGYLNFLGLFLLAQVAGLVSQIPGGLGVFETVLLLLLEPYLPASSILGMLLAFRGVYYLLPLGAALILLGSHELMERRQHIRKLARIFGKWAPTLAPNVLAFTTFVGGAVLLFSGATPAVGSRLLWLKDFLPLPVIEISHFLASLLGIGLILLAQSVQRRLDAAYIAATALMAAGAVLCLLKGFDYEEAVVLALMLAALLPARLHFYRHSSLVRQRFNFGWAVAVASILACTIWLGAFSFKHVAYSHQLWWQFTLGGDAPRFLRAMVGTVAIGLFFTLGRLLRASATAMRPAAGPEVEQAEEIADRSPATYAQLASLGDKSFLFSDSGNAFIMYRVAGQSWVAMGDPVGPKAEMTELIWRFRELCDLHDGWTVFYQVSARHRERYLDLGLTLLKLGEEARVPLAAFSLEEPGRRELRDGYRRLNQAGLEFEIVPPAGVPPLLPELEKISDAWLRGTDTREKSFSVGRFEPAYLQRFPLALIRKRGRILAFANIWPGAQRFEMSVDLMRFLPGEAPDGILDYLFTHLLLVAKQAGYQRFNLGMAPLAGLETRKPARLWNQLGELIYQHAEPFYHVEGLRSYKEKFDPVWEPRYLAAPGGLVWPRVLAHLTTLISGGTRTTAPTGGAPAAG